MDGEDAGEVLGRWARFESARARLQKWLAKLATV